MTELEKLRKQTGESDEELLSLLLEDAENFVLSNTNRTTLTPALRKTVRDLAVIAYNRQGTEGESGRSEGGESYSFEDIPDHIHCTINQYRLFRAGGVVHEAKEK